MNTQYQAVLFDLDGTLLDTLDDLADATNAALAAGGFATHPVEAYKIFVGNGARKLIERALPQEHRTPETIESTLQQFRTQYSQCWDAKTRPYDGVVELLEQLVARNLPMVVLSNKPNEFTQLCVKRFFPDVPFRIVQGVDETCPPKPDPSGALAITKTLDVQPQAFLYLGDTNTDMQTANQAGMFAVGVSWGFRSVEELQQADAKAIIHQPAELLKLL